MCMLAVTSSDAIALRLIYRPAFMDDWQSQGVLPYKESSLHAHSNVMTVLEAATPRDCNRRKPALIHVSNSLEYRTHRAGSAENNYFLKCKKKYNK